MKEEHLSQKEIRELEEMARIGKEEFSGDLSKIENQISDRIDTLIPANEEVNTSDKYRKWGLVILGFFALAYLAYSIIGSSPKQTPSIEYADAYYNAPPFVISQEERGGNDINDQFSDIKDAYKEKNYAAVLSLTEYNSPDIALYRGIALLELNRTEEAIRTLELSTEGELKDMAMWYLALAHLKQDNVSSSRLALEIIIKIPDHYKIAEAKDLLQKLEAK